MRFKKFNIDAYEPGKSSVNNLKKVIKLSANESALGMSSKVKKIISNKNLNFFRYPDGKSKGSGLKSQRNLNAIKTELFVGLDLMRLFRCYVNYF